jgi:DNA-binding response OmpR family regulator
MGNKEVTEKDILVCIVDDHVYSVTSLSHFLESNGFRTIFAYNGEEAIKLCRKEKPDVLILDIAMQGKSGFEVAQELTDTKILFMSSHEELKEKALQFKNCIGFIPKPVNTQELIEVIRNYFRIKKPQEY